MNAATPPEIKAMSFLVPEGPARPLDRALREATGLSWQRCREAIESGKIRVDGEPVTDPRQRIASGSRVELVPSAPRRRGAPPLGAAALVWVDPHVVVVEKPPGISSVPFEDEPGTLIDLARDALKRREHRAIPPLGVVQRLDKDTSGLCVFARTLAAKRHLKQQFRFHTVHRRYVALAHGRVDGQTMVSRLVEDRGDGLRGSTDNPRIGQEAITHVRVLEHLRDATLIECRLETGRTHQIRIHLAESGHPLLGERVYARGFRGELIAAPRLMLHAAELGFVHPESQRALSFVSDLPPEFARQIAALGGRPPKGGPARAQAKPAEARSTRARRPGAARGRPRS